MIENHQIRHIIVVVVKQHKIKEYERWLEKVRQKIIHFEGFIGVDVIKESDFEFLIINRFKNHDCYEKWNNSPELEELVEESDEYIVHRNIKIQRIGIDLFFDKPNISDLLPQPALYKRVVVGIITVYPIILIATYTLIPFIEQFNLPVWKNIFLSTCIISPMIGFVLPLVSKLFNKWLYSNR